MADILETLRQAMKASGRTRYRIAQESGIAESVLSRFASGERGLSIELAQRLANTLDLELVIQPRKKRPTKGT